MRSLHAYMQLVTFGINKDRNLIIQFPSIHTTIHTTDTDTVSIRTVPVPIIDQN